MSASLAANIDALLVKFDITPAGLAKICDVSTATVSRWRTGKASIRPANLARICEALEVSEDDLTSDQFGLAAKMHGRYGVPVAEAYASAPLLGRVHAGDAQEPEILDGCISAPKSVIDHHPSAYFLQVEGDCMDRVYPEGCYILIDPDQAPRNGSIAVVSIDGEDYVMRRLFKGANTLVLSPDSHNKDHEDIVISSDSQHVVEFHGTVVWFQSSKEME